MRQVLIVLLLVPLAAPALASDGVLEISQTCAVETGCFPGDAPGFPVTIGTSGSYRLTSNLAVPDEHTDGITFSDTTVSNISIDLAGFEIRGPVVCSGSPLACTPSLGSGNGVSAPDFRNRGLSVTNGSVTGMGRYGVYLGDQAEVRDLRARWNRSTGLYTGRGSTVSGSTAYQNGGVGIVAQAGSSISGSTAYQNRNIGIGILEGSTLSDNAAYQNGSDGISLGTGSTASGNAAYGNAGRGIVANSSSLVEGNTAIDNTGNGIEAGTASTVRGNTARGNLQRGIDVRFGAHVVDNTVYNNGDGEATDDGISCEGGCTIHRNTARSNAGYGIRAGSANSSYKDNTVSNNATGTVLSGTDACGNVLNGTLSCP